MTDQNEASATTSESSMLLPHAGDKKQCSQTGRGPSFTQKVNCCSHLCIPSKTAVVIIISAPVIGYLYYVIMCTGIAMMDNPASII